MTTVGRRPASTPRQLTRVGDRLSFIYLERCVVHRDSNALTAEDADGVTHVPSATIGALLLGPGTRITHQAMALLGETGAAVVWVGEHGVRFYAGGRALNRSSSLVEAQAIAWANQRTRLDVARAMYRLRFPDEDPAGLTRRQLLGREGDRVKRCYASESARTGVPWRGRRFVPGDFGSGDPPNQAITAAAQCMYGIAHTVVAALGCSPGLGFVHSGHELSFVLDIADLYKTDIGIPIAFEVAAEGPEDIGSRTRRALRDRINESGLLDRCVRDIQGLLVPATGLSSDNGDHGDVGDNVTLLSDKGARRLRPQLRRRSDRAGGPRAGGPRTGRRHLVTIIILTHCPVGLRGFLTRWLLEISPGVFLGNPSARIRDALWDEVRQYAGNGRALLAYSTNTEQGYTFRTHDHKWQPTDHEGLTLIRRPSDRHPPASAPPATGWSKASKRRRFGNRAP